MFAKKSCYLDECLVRKDLRVIYFFSPISIKAFACYFVMKLLISFAVVGEKLFSNLYFLLSFSGLAFVTFCDWVLKMF